MVWIGTARALPAVARPTGPEVVDWSCLEPIADDAPVRARFTAPHVTYVGSHQGCGCGFFSSEDEGDDFEAEQRSRERLRALIEGERAAGPVELFVCWAGGERDAAIASRVIDPAWITEHLEPFEEQTHYAITPHG